MTFQHSSLPYFTLLVKDQGSFYEICKTLNWLNKQLNILKTFLEYLKFYILAY